MASITFDFRVGRFRRGGRFVSKSIGMRSSKARAQYQALQRARARPRVLLREEYLGEEGEIFDDYPELWFSSLFELDDIEEYWGGLNDSDTVS